MLGSYGLSIGGPMLKLPLLLVIFHYIWVVGITLPTQTMYLLLREDSYETVVVAAITITIIVLVLVVIEFDIIYLFNLISYFLFLMYLCDRPPIFDRIVSFLVSMQCYCSCCLLSLPLLLMLRPPSFTIKKGRSIVWSHPSRLFYNTKNNKTISNLVHTITCWCCWYQ